MCPRAGRACSWRVLQVRAGLAEKAGPGPIAVGSATGVSSLRAWRFDGGFGRSGVMGAEAAAGHLSPWLHLCAGKPPRP